MRAYLLLVHPQHLRLWLQRGLLGGGGQLAADHPDRVTQGPPDCSGLEHEDAEHENAGKQVQQGDRGEFQSQPAVGDRHTVVHQLAEELTTPGNTCKTCF